LWPAAEFTVVTNGTYLNHHREIYDILKQEKSRMFLELTMHGKTMQEKILNDLNNFLKPPVKKIYSSKVFPVSDWQHTWNRIKDPSWPDCPTIEDLFNLPEYIQKECFEFHDLGHYMLIDSNGVRVLVSNQAEFVLSAVQMNDQGQLELHQSDPAKAADVCISKFCHHFSRGKLYKCGVTGILPDFISQFDVKVNDQDRKLIHSYMPGDVEWSDNKMIEFLKNLTTGDPVAQCKFCTESRDTITFDSSAKKPKATKLKNIPVIRS
jgi:hypothetical protein